MGPVGDDRRIDVFVCRRGHSPDVKYCYCGARAVKRCCQRLTGRRDGNACGKLLCQSCATPSGKGTDPGLCAQHAPKQEAWDPTQRPRRSS